MLRPIPVRSLSEVEGVQDIRQVAAFDDEEPVWLTHLAGHLRQILVGTGPEAHLDDG
jgi:hypothetical protein